MKNRYTIIIALLILTASIVLLWSNTNNKNAVVSDTTEITENEIPSELKGDSVADEEIDNEGEDSVVDLTERYKSTVKRLDDDRFKTQEFYQCFNENVNLCIDQSYKSLSQINNDESFCDGLEKDIAINECKKSLYIVQGLLTGDVNKCSGLSNKKLINECKNEIYNSLSRMKNNINYCNKIVDSEYQKEDCKNNLYLELAITNNDVNYCDKITTQYDEAIKEECRDEVEAFIGN